ncbi:hypothetical protein [Alicyclobacillus fodiniaquatilis]|uniref:Uncharacterized protein n=1 Tax=Alicyclobacillus fodiniaquatilis TaxID=1661150 RepID=A0ABW4JIG5_9BACL
MNIRRVLIILFSIVLFCSVGFNVMQYQNKQVLGKDLLDSSDGIFIDLNDASDDIAKNKGQDAIAFLSWAVGGLLVIRQPLTHYGVSQLTGITLELQKVQGVLSEPQNFKASEVKSMKAFVTSSAMYFRNCIVNDEVSVPKLKLAIQQIYAVMPSNDRAQFEGAGP